MIDLQEQKVDGQFFTEAVSTDNLFSGLSQRVQRSLDSISETTQFDKDTIVIAENQFPRIYLLVEGQAEINFFNSINHRFIFRSVKQNEMVGLVETVADLRFRFSLRTVSECRFQSIEQKEFMSFLQHEPRLCFQLIKHLGNDISTTSRAFTSTSFH
jgi:CRP-like cAMP-binding protein